MARAVYAIGGGGLGGAMPAGVGSSLYASRLVRWVVAARGGGLGFAVPAGVGGGLCTRWSVCWVGMACAWACICVARYVATCVAGVAYI